MQGVELCQMQGRAFRHDRAAPYQTVSSRMQEGPELVCRCLAVALLLEVRLAAG